MNTAHCIHRYPTSRSVFVLRRSLLLFLVCGDVRTAHSVEMLTKERQKKHARFCVFVEITLSDVEDIKATTATTLFSVFYVVLNVRTLYGFNLFVFLVFH